MFLTVMAVGGSVERSLPMDMRTPEQNIPEQRLDLGTTQYKQEPGSARLRDLSEGPGRGGQMYRGERALVPLLWTHLSQKLKDHILPFGHTGVGQGVGNFQAWCMAPGPGFPSVPLYHPSQLWNLRDVLHFLHVSYPKKHASSPLKQLWGF